jgi:hypothetical protein
MKCIEISELLSLYIDNMLDENQVREVEEHLSSCDACRSEYNELKETVELLGQAEMIPVPDEFSFRLKKALKEEKQKMIDEGLIVKQPKKKNQWRIITSIAAVFAVCAISYSLYDNVMGTLPFFKNGADQAGPASATEEVNKKVADMREAESDSYSGSALDDESSDGSVVMKDQTENAQSPGGEEESAQYEIAADMGGAQTYGAAAGSEPYEGERSAGGIEPEAAADTDGSSGEFAFKSSMASSQDECSRSLTGSGLERNSAAVQFYNMQIEEKLSGFDYQILETVYSQTGEWQFRVFIFRGKDGNTYNEEIMIIGKDGKIQTICSNDFMGL